jgi:lipopolysaccharide heptosyltransferase II
MFKTHFLKTFDRLIGPVLVHLMPKPHLMPVSVPRRILFIRPGGIGDAVLLIPAIQALKEKFPESSICVLAERRNAAIFSFCRAVDSTYRYDCLRELVKVLYETYDVIIDTEQWHRLSAVIARLCGAQVLIGFATNRRKRLFTHPVSYSHNTYEKDSFFSLLEPLGINGSAEGITPFFTVTEETLVSACGKLRDCADRQFVALFPGASIPERRWGAEKFREIAARLRTRGLGVVVVGGKGDESTGEAITAAGMGLNLAGRTSLAETAAILTKSLLLVTGDSGLLHIAVALGVPTVSLFGPGIARKWAPRSEQHIVLNKHLACSPCTRFGSTPRCPIGARCLTELAVDEVDKAVIRLLEKNPVWKFPKQEQFP